MWKENIPEAYNRSCIEEIKYKVIDFTHKSAKEMLKHLNKQCLYLTNVENKEQFKETEFLWNTEDFFPVHFTKLHKEKEWFKKVGIN